MPAIRQEALTAHLEKQLLPAYLISGDEPLLVSEAADAVRARARADGFTEREVHFIERAAGWNDVRASLSSLSLFATRRIVEIRMPTGKPGVAGSAALVQLLSAGIPDTLLLILTGRLDRDAQSGAWVKAAQTHGGWVQIWPVGPDRLVAWLRGRCRQLGLSADDDALELLAERTEGNLLAAHQELAKLQLLSPKGRITAEIVLGGVADSARFDAFQLSGAVLEGDAPRALRMIAGLRAEGVEPTLVLWAVNKAVKDLWNASSAQGGGRPQAWARQTAALDQAKRRVPRLSFARLNARAARADRMIKGRLSGNAWDEIALLAVDLCAKPALPLPKSVFK